MKQRIKLSSIIVKSGNSLIEEANKHFNIEKGKWYINPDDLPSITSISTWFEPNEYNVNNLVMRQPNPNEWRVFDNGSLYMTFKYLGEKDFMDEFEDQVNKEIDRRLKKSDDNDDSAIISMDGN